MASPRWAFGELKNGGIRICRFCGEVSLEDDMHWCTNPEDIVATNPIDDIEDKNIWKDFGKQGYFILKGAIDEGATEEEAVLVLKGFYSGIADSAKDDSDEGDN